MKLPRLSQYRTGGAGDVMQLSLPVPRTPDGRVYRYSPNEQAHPRHFVLGDTVVEIAQTPDLRSRMKQDPRSPRTVCPYSGTIADDSDFTHPDDVNAALETVKHEASQDIEDAFANMFANAFRGGGSRGGFVSITAKVTRSTPKPRPRFPRKDLMRELICDHCGRDYGVFAIGLFCPDCGAPNLRLHFKRETELVGDQVSLAEEVGREREEFAHRLLGNAHEDVLTAFEATLKTVYLYGKVQAGASSLPRVGNDFQNIDRATQRFDELGVKPFDQMGDPEMASLRLNIQKRHIIGHNLGVVDEKFAVHAIDAKVGETVHLVAEDIRQFAALSQSVIDKLDAWLGGSPSPTIGDLTKLADVRNYTLDPDDPKNLMALQLKLSLLARKVALWVAEQSAKGHDDYVSAEVLGEAFPEVDDAAMREAVAELETDGFIRAHHTLDDRLPDFQPLLELYLTFDEAAFGHDTTADTLALGDLVIAGPDGVDPQALMAQTGWGLRRFNPVLAHIAAQLPDERVSQAYDDTFSVSSFFMLAKDRIRLKRFVASIRR